jgi:hypothetical protein
MGRGRAGNPEISSVSVGVMMAEDERKREQRTRDGLGREREQERATGETPRRTGRKTCY